MPRAICVLVLLVATSAATPPPWQGMVYGELHGENRSLQLFLARDGSLGTFSVQAARIQLVLRPLDGTASRSLSATSSGTIVAIPGSRCQGPLFNESRCFYGRNFLELIFLLAPSDQGAYAVTLKSDSAAYASGASPVTIGSGVSPPLLYVPQLPDDVGLRDARQRYLGKTVYAMPTTVERELHCSGDPSAIEDIPAYHTAVITAIERTNGTAEIGTFQSTDGDFVAIQPLRVTIAAPEQGAGPPGSCTQRYIFMADPWEMERRFALHDPRDHPEWPARFREALAQGKILVGMTHAMVASVLGYPAHFGTVEELDRLTAWKYDAPTPFQSSVTFRGNAVIKYDPPGNLP